MQRVVLQGKDQLASEKAVIARKLAEMHYRADAGLQKVIRLTGEAETEVQPSEPIKLLEVNEHTCLRACASKFRSEPSRRDSIPHHDRRSHAGGVRANSVR